MNLGAIYYVFNVSSFFNLSFLGLTTLMHECHIEFRAVGPMLLAYAIFLCILIQEISLGACPWTPLVTHRDQGVVKKRQNDIVTLFSEGC